MPVATDNQNAQQEQVRSRNDQTHPADGPQSQKQPPVPQWISDLMDAAQAGDNEFRKEVRKAIDNNRGQQLIKIAEVMAETAKDGKQKQQANDMLKNIKTWVNDPSQLEEGRFLGLGHGGMFSGLMGMFGGYGGYGGLGNYLGGWGSGYGSGYGGYGMGGYDMYGGYGGYGGGYGGWW